MGVTNSFTFLAAALTPEIERYSVRERQTVITHRVNIGNVRTDRM